MGSHLTIRLLDPKTLRIVKFDRTHKYVMRRIAEYGTTEDFLEAVQTSHEVVARYTVPRAVVDAANAKFKGRPFHGWLEKAEYWSDRASHPTIDPVLKPYRDYWRTCQTLPGELGLGLWVPALWPSGVARLTSLYMGGVIPTAAGVWASAR